MPDLDKGDGENVKAVVLTAPENLAAMQTALQGAGNYLSLSRHQLPLYLSSHVTVGIECAGKFAWNPLALVDCSSEDTALNLAALDALEEIEDVDSVEHNMNLN